MENISPDDEKSIIAFILLCFRGFMLRCCVVLAEEMAMESIG